MRSPKILLFANTDWYLYNFRRSLAERLRADGWEVVLVSPPGEYAERLQGLGFRWVAFPFSTRSMNPFVELSIIFNLMKLYLRERPKLVHHFTIKCVLYGSIAARLTGGIQSVNAVPGLGYIFTSRTLKTNLVRPLVKLLYRVALGGVDSRVIFQNSEDRDSFVDSGLVPLWKTFLIRGSGVNVAQFKPQNCKPCDDKHIKVIFASRLLREKGVFELVAAAESLINRGYPVEVFIAGDVYPDNPSSLLPEEVRRLAEKSFVHYLGHVDDMPALLVKMDIVALPSYYGEGTPRILIEAAAMGKPLVATDIAGCRGLVLDGENGFLVPVKSVDPLAAALEKLVRDPGLRSRFGQRGREIVLAEFDERIVLDKTLRVYGGPCESGTRDAAR